MPLTDLVLALLLFSVCWVGACFGLAAIGGWSRLAEHYAQGDRPFVGETRRCVRGSLGPFANYGSALVLGRGAAGIRLALLPIVPVGHPPLLIPWSDVLPPTLRGLGPFRRAEMTFAKAPGVRLRVRRAHAEWLLAGREKSLDRLPASSG